MPTNDEEQGRYDVTDLDPEESELDDSPARIRIYVTSTKNPSKPRTLRAGYDYKTGTMTVVFPDGTFWNYYRITEIEWNSFKSAPSKGEWLHVNGFNNKPHGIGEGMMGKANIHDLSTNMIRSLGASKEAQIAMHGKQSSRLGGPRVQAALQRHIRGLGSQQ